MKKNGTGTSPEIKEDIGFQRVFWRVERTGWVLMGVFIVVSLLGFTGVGPLNSVRARQNGLEVTYDQLSRYLAPTRINVMFPGTGDPAIVQIDKLFLEGYEVRRITPRPDSTVTDEDTIEYRFTNSGSEPSVMFDLRPNSIGARKGSISSSQQAEVFINQFVLP